MYPLLNKYLPLIHRAYETLTNQKVTATSTEKRNYISSYSQKNKRYAFKYHVLPMVAPAWETGSSYYIQVDHTFETYAEVEGYTPLKQNYRSGLTRTDLNILKTRSVLVNGSKVGLKAMQGGCHPHASYFVPAPTVKRTNERSLDEKSKPDLSRLLEWATRYPNPPETNQRLRAGILWDRQALQHGDYDRCD